MLITGSDGFIAQNLIAFFEVATNWKLMKFRRGESDQYLKSLIQNCDLIIHLAGENRPDTSTKFHDVNVGLTKKICKFIGQANRAIPVIFSSSIQVDVLNDYGISKKNAETVLIEHSHKTKSPVAILRLPNIFGKWSRPNYNSVVATWINNILCGRTCEISDPNKSINLMYIDDLVMEIYNIVTNKFTDVFYPDITCYYTITLSDLLTALQSCSEQLERGVLPVTQDPFKRAIYATFKSFLEIQEASYSLDCASDERGKFVEFIKTQHNGQVSVLTVNPGMVRGCHYHNTKVEKFLVILGEGRFCFRNIQDNQRYELVVKGSDNRVVETPPGWAHSIENIGVGDLITVIWASELFDKNNPDTYTVEM